MRSAKIVLLVLAAHLVILSFFFFKPQPIYLIVTGLSTITVWPCLYYLDQKGRWTTILAGSLMQLLVQQVAFHIWLKDGAVVWPFLQFISLQYIVAWRLSSAGA